MGAGLCIAFATDPGPPMQANRGAREDVVTISVRSACRVANRRGRPAGCSPTRARLDSCSLVGNHRAAENACRVCARHRGEKLVERHTKQARQIDMAWGQREPYITELATSTSPRALHAQPAGTERRLAR